MEEFQQQEKNKEEPITRDDSISRQQLKNEIQKYAQKLYESKNEVEKVIRGQEHLILSVLRGFIGEGNILLEGRPGLGKTTLCKTFSEIFNLDFKRTQFTTDITPQDIIGTQGYSEEKGFEIKKGPIFTNLFLVDDINRAPQKVQSSLLEAMGEKQVTLGNKAHRLDEPFNLMATQVPSKRANTFPLTEGHMDRFMMKVNMEYPSPESELQIIENNLSAKFFSEFGVQNILSKYEILIIQKLRKRIYADDKIKNYIIDIINSTRNPYKAGLSNADLIELGASTRASIDILTGAKSQALIKGRDYVIPTDVKDVVHEILRHRIYLDQKSRELKVIEDDIISEIIKIVKIY